MASRTADYGLLERDNELAQLMALLDDARGNAGRLVVVEGPAGIGKSELLRGVRDIARGAGMTTLSARGGELERNYPFGLVRQLYEPALQRDRDGLLAGAARRAEALLLGEAADPRPGLDAAFQLYHALYWLTVNLSDRRPLLLCVDDAHWGDAPSLEFLAYLVRRVDELPILIALGVRTGETDAEPDSLASLRADMLAETIEPEPLTLAAVTTLVRKELGKHANADLCRACHEVSAGNPFMLRELLREVSTSADRFSADQVREVSPRGVARAVLLRLSRIDEGAVELARGVAVLGDGADLDIAASLAGLDRQEAAGFADALAAAQVLDAGRPLRFVHPLTRTAIYSDLPEGRRAELHRRAADLLSASGHPVEASAAHFLATDAAGDDGAVKALRAAARKSLARGRPDAAKRYLGRALREPPAEPDRPAVLMELFEAELLTGDVSGVERFNQFSAGDQVELKTLAEFAPNATRGMFALGEGERGFEFLAALVANIAPDDAELALRLDAELVAIAVRFPQTLARARQRLDRYIERVEHPATPAERMMAANLAFDRAMRGKEAAETIALAQRALADGALLASETSDSQPFYAAVEALILCDQPRLAEEPIAQALADARRRGSALALALASIEECLAAHFGGRLRSLEAAARTTLTVAREGGWAPAVPNLVAMLVESLVERDELEAAARELELAGIAELIPLEARGAMRLLGARGVLRLARGEREAGAQDLLLAADAAEIAGFEVYELYGCRASVALRGTESRADGLARVERALDRAEAFGAGRQLGEALRSKALLVEGEEALLLLERSAAVLAESTARLDHARSLVEYGAALGRSKQRKAARETLREGLRLAETCDAVRLADRVREELAAVGERVPARPVTPADSLTGSERRVAEMAAQGMSNKEIAQALFLTRKTIEFHLSNVYRKLDISSREQLPDILERPSASS